MYVEAKLDSNVANGLLIPYILIYISILIINMNLDIDFVTQPSLFHQVQDQPLHPDTDLVANILGNRPDGSSSTLAESLVPPIVTLNPPEAVESYVPQYCGGEVIAKVNEVDTLLSPGQ